MKNRQKSEAVRREFSARLIAAMDMKKIPERKRAGALAKATGLTREAVRKWLTAMSIPSKANMKLVARMLGVRQEWLEYGEGPMLAPEGSEVEELLEGVRERLRGLEGARRERLLETLRFLAEK